MTETPWPKSLSTITLFVEDLAATRQFYLDVFGLPVHFEDDSSAVFDFGNTLVNLLDVSQAPELVEPAPVGRPGVGSRCLLTVNVDDVDAACDRVRAAGVDLLNGPDRPAVGRTHRSLPRPGRARVGDRPLSRPVWVRR